jgi:glutamate 5-kinase
MIELYSGLVEHVSAPPLAPVDRPALVRQQRELVMVSSGAIAEGMKRLGWTSRPHGVHELQAAAAVGQMGLAQFYESALREHGIGSAQVLLTHADLADRERYLNARSTLTTLLGLGVVPVINENDTVVTDEIKFGDNDTLSAMVASLTQANCLVILSTAPGLIDMKGTGKVVPVVEKITPEIEAMAGDAGSELSRGGMRTKIEAGRIALAAGTDMVIASGKVMNPLKAIADGGTCTWFLAHSDPVTARKRWIAGQLEPKGALIIDAGAERALGSGKSLLPAGVMRLEGTFERGDAVVIRSADGREIGRGLVAYACADAERILGKKSSEIAGILGHTGRAELVHRDDMALRRG